MTRRRRGYSFAELMVVLAFIGLLVRLAVPRYLDMKRRAVSGAILADVHTLQLALFTRYAETQDWPPDSGPGVVPPELAPYLPGNFNFTRPDYEYDYEQWTLTSGTPSDPQQQTMIGIAVQVSDPRLISQLLLTAARGYGPFVTGNRITFFVTGFSGS